MLVKTWQTGKAKFERSRSRVIRSPTEWSQKITCTEIWKKMNLHIARVVPAILRFSQFLTVYNEKFGWDAARCKCKCKCKLFPAMSMGMDQRYIRECRAWPDELIKDGIMTLNGIVSAHFTTGVFSTFSKTSRVNVWIRIMCKSKVCC